MKYEKYYKHDVVTCDDSAIATVLLSDIKRFLRISHMYDDELLIDLLTACVEYAEKFITTTIVPKEILLQTNDFTKSNDIYKILLPTSPIINILKINAIKELIKLDDEEHKDDIVEQHAFKTILCNISNVLSIQSTELHEAFAIRFTAGYNTIPPLIKQGILLHVAQLYDDQENDVTPNHAMKLYNLYRKVKI